MMTEQGKIIAVKDSKVWVAVERSSACGKCSAQAGCGQGLMSKVLPTQRLVFTIEIDKPVKEGDEVTLGLEDSAVLGASWVLYGIPLAVMLVFTMLAGGVWQWSEGAQIVAALSGLALGFVAVALYGRLGAGFNQCQPHVMSVRSKMGEELIATSLQPELPPHAHSP